jgi:hypothetical protein
MLLLSFVMIILMSYSFIAPPSLQNLFIYLTLFTPKALPYWPRVLNGGGFQQEGESPSEGKEVPTVSQPRGILLPWHEVAS